MFTFSIFSGLPLRHAVFLRHGGVSSGPFASLNFSTAQGDSPENVKKNLEIARERLHFEEHSAMIQTHGKEIFVADSTEKPEADGLITQRPGLALLVLHADCQAAIFYDPIHHALANIHCGWRGNVQNIYGATVEKMHKLYGSQPSDLLVAISPSLGPEASEFKHFRDEFPKELWQFQSKNMFNLWELSRWQLCQAGVLDKNIEIAGICTYAHPEDYFSYRREKRSGRHATIALLEEL